MSQESSILLAILTSLSDVAREAFLHPQNRNRVRHHTIPSPPPADPISREVTPAIDLEGVNLTLSLDRNLLPLNPRRGFVFGNAKNESSVDIVLANRSSYGVSKEHFSIRLHAADGTLVLTNISQFGTRVRSTRRGTRLLRSGDGIALVSDDKIEAGLAHFRVWIAPRPKDAVARAIFAARVQVFADQPASSPRAVEPSHPITIENPNILTLRFPSIGKGAFGRVFRASGTNDEKYAVKIFNLESAREQVQEQLHLLDTIDHPHIVKVYPSLRLATAEYADKPYLVMELAEGSLDKLTNLLVVHVELIFRQLFDAVACLHAQGYVHRDLKPQNVLIRSTDPLHVIVTDFDTVKWDIPLSKFCGTGRYIAPELVRAELDRREETAFYGKRVDVWALGIMLLDYCVADGLTEPSTSDLGRFPLPRVAAWNTAVLAFLEKEADAKPGFEHLLQVARLMLVEDPNERPEVRYCEAFLEDAVTQRNSEEIRKQMLKYKPEGERSPTPTEPATDSECELLRRPRRLEGGSCYTLPFGFRPLRDVCVTA